MFFISSCFSSPPFIFLIMCFYLASTASAAHFWYSPTASSYHWLESCFRSDSGSRTGGLCGYRWHRGECWCVRHVLTWYNNSTSRPLTPCATTASGRTCPTTILPIKYEYLSDRAMIAFPKIFWIKIIQRRWKKIMAERKRIINNRKSIKEVIQYQYTGKWSKY